LRTGNRLVDFIGDVAGDEAHAWQGEVDVVDELLVGDLQRFALFERTPLAVAQRQVSAAPDRHRITAGRQILDLVAAVRVAARGAVLGAQLRRGERDPRPA